MQLKLQLFQMLLVFFIFVNFRESKMAISFLNELQNYIFKSKLKLRISQARKMSVIVIVLST